MRALILSALAFLAANSANAAEKTRLYADKVNGFEIAVPAILNHTKCTADDAPCEQFGTGSVAKLKKSGDYDFILQPRAKNLAAAIADSDFFIGPDTGSSLQVDPKMAKHVAANGWEGIYDNVTCGATDEYGFHPDIAECLVAAVSDGTRTVIVKTGTVDEDHPEAFIETLKTLRFTATK